MALLDVVTPLPKILFVILEDDIIKELKNSKDENIQYLFQTNNFDGLAHLLGRNFEWAFTRSAKTTGWSQ